MPRPGGEGTIILKLSALLCGTWAPTCLSDHFLSAFLLTLLQSHLAFFLCLEITCLCPLGAFANTLPPAPFSHGWSLPAIGGHLSGGACPDCWLSFPLCLVQALHSALLLFLPGTYHCQSLSDWVIVCRPPPASQTGPAALSVVSQMPDVCQCPVRRRPPGIFTCGLRRGFQCMERAGVWSQTVLP